MRNLSLDLNKDRYCLWCDVDDILTTPSGIRDLILKNPHIDVFKVKILSYTERGTVETIVHNRLFRRVKDGKTPYWVNSCHEDISYSMNDLGYTHAFTDLVIKHFGYLNIKSWIKKNERNLKLMQSDLSKIDKDKEKGRLSMLYYGIVNALIILAGTKKDKERQNSLVQALDITDKCIANLTHEDPLTAKMWMLRGIICHDAKQFAAAKQSYLKAYDEWKQPEAAVNLCDIYILEKKYDEVIKILSEVLNKYKGAYPFQNLSYDPVQLHSLLLEKLATAYAKKAQDNPTIFGDNMQKAELYYRESMNIRPKVEILNVLCQILRNTGRIDEAAFLTIKAVNKWPKFFKGWSDIGEYELMSGRTETAKLFFREALRLNPNCKEANHNLLMINKGGKE